MKPYAKILQKMNNMPIWVRLMKIRVYNLVTLSLGIAGAVHIYSGGSFSDVVAHCKEFGGSL